VAFADDLILIIRADSIREAGNIAKVEMDKIATWAENNKTRFNGKKKSKVMLMTRRKCKEQKRSSSTHKQQCHPTGTKIKISRNNIRLQTIF